MARQTGLKNIYVATVLSDVVGVGTTYSTPIKLERGVKAALKINNIISKFYSDDNIEQICTLFDSVDVTIELNQLSLASRAILQGSRIVKGQLSENKNDMIPTLAFGFQSIKADNNIRYVWLFKGSFAAPDDTFQTEDDKINDQTATITGSFYARDSDLNYRITIDSDAVNADPAVIASWFTSVPILPIGSIVTTMTVVAGMTGIATSVVGTVITIHLTSTVAQAYTALQVDGGNGTFKIWSSVAKTALALNVAAVTSAMVIEATAQDGITKSTYTVVTA